LILDLTAGNRAVWFNKYRSDCIFVDKRISVRPSVVADSTNLPFADGTFDLVVFDPPHVNAGKNSNTSASYGWYTTSQIRELISLTAREAYRVTSHGAIMAFKWNDHDQPIGPVISLMERFWDILCGHKVAEKMKRPSHTFWALLKRRQEI
jgi:tRNA G10  N-methylase Trm11